MSGVSWTSVCSRRGSGHPSGTSYKSTPHWVGDYPCPAVSTPVWDPVGHVDSTRRVLVPYPVPVPTTCPLLSTHPPKVPLDLLHLCTHPPHEVPPLLRLGGQPPTVKTSTSVLYVPVLLSFTSGLNSITLSPKSYGPVPGHSRSPAVFSRAPSPCSVPTRVTDKNTLTISHYNRFPPLASHPHSSPATPCRLKNPLGQLHSTT